MSVCWSVTTSMPIFLTHIRTYVQLILLRLTHFKKINIIPSCDMIVAIPGSNPTRYLYILQCERAQPGEHGGDDGRVEPLRLQPKQQQLVLQTGYSRRLKE